MAEVIGEFGYILDDIRPLLAQWSNSLADDDLSGCAVGGGYYNKALGELQEALLTGGYTVTTSTPIARQRCLDILCQGIACYYAEGHTMQSYQDQYNPVAGYFGRYRQALRDIAAGEPLGELNKAGKSRCYTTHRPGQNPLTCVQNRRWYGC